MKSLKGTHCKWASVCLYMQPFSHKDEKKFESDHVITAATLEAIILYGSTFYDVIPNKDRITFN